RLIPCHELSICADASCYDKKDGSQAVLLEDRKCLLVVRPVSIIKSDLRHSFARTVLRQTGNKRKVLIELLICDSVTVFRGISLNLVVSENATPANAY